MKTALKTVGFLVVAVAVYGLGVWTGNAHSLFNKMWGIRVISESATKASLLSLHIDQLNKREYDELKAHLNLQLTAEIITLDSIIDWANPSDNDEAAVSVLNRIMSARVREGYVDPDARIEALLLKIRQKLKSRAPTNVSSVTVTRGTPRAEHGSCHESPSAHT
jgi:hypothetical protein